MKRLSLSLAFAVCAVLVVPAAGAAPLGATFTSAAGDWLFEYPDDWELSESRETAWTLANFVGTATSVLEDGQLRIQFTIEPNARDLSLSDLRSQECSTSRRDVVNLIECRPIDINGRQWIRSIADEGGTESKVVRAVTVFNGKVYRAVGSIGSGPSEDSAVEDVKRVYNSFELRRAGIARTGVSLPLFLVAAAMLVMLGGGMRLSGRRA